jgi:hypothetical protein
MLPYPGRHVLLCRLLAELNGALQRLQALPALGTGGEMLFHLPADGRVQISVQVLGNPLQVLFA